MMSNNHYNKKTETFRSVSEIQIFVVAQLIQIRDAGEIDHGRRPTHQYDRIRSWSEQVVLYHRLVDKAGTVLPTCTTDFPCSLRS